MNTKIQVKDFYVSRGTFSMQNINLSINKGEIFAILGKTGSGKSVLLESMMGMYKGSEGTITIDDINVHKIPLQDRKIGFVYQDHMLFPNMTVRKNIEYGLKMHKVDKEMINKKSTEVMELLGITHIQNQKIQTISGGESQRTALARALVLEPEILFFDEPFSALDPMTTEKLCMEIKRIHEKYGCTIVFVTHDFNEAQMLADRVGILLGGRMCAIVKSNELFTRKINEEVDCFLGKQKTERNYYYDSRKVL